MPSGAVFTAYSAYRFAYKDASDYSEIYVYLPKKLIEIKERFPPKTVSKFICFEKILY